jgi:hypothetical protein
MTPATTTRRALVVRIQVLGMHAALMTALSAVAVPPVAAQETSSRVRSHSVRVLDAIERGTKSSPTFRRLIETIDATDGLVFVNEGLCTNGVRACLLLSVTVVGPSRVLYILVNLRKARGCEMNEMIGHELQHAIEVLSNPRVRTDRQIYNFFDVVGRTSAGRFETKAALKTGIAIAREGCGGW